MSRIIVATQNQHKVKEIRQITEEFGLEVVSLGEVGLGSVDIEETGTTFEENSLIKAQAIMEMTGEIAIADDSGLEVDCLGGEPGVYSARYGGPNASDQDNKDKLIKALEPFGFSQRTGRFVTVVTMVFPNGEKLVARGQVEGRLILEERGTNGFGYDPLFIPEGYEETFGQMSPQVKNSISHRSRALVKLKELFEDKRRELKL